LGVGLVFWLVGGVHAPYHVELRILGIVTATGVLCWAWSAHDGDPVDVVNRLLLRYWAVLRP
jgi:hypothetical protein